MTTINCSSDCIYQNEGKCTFDKIVSTKLNSKDNCAYYKSKKNR